MAKQRQSDHQILHYFCECDDMAFHQGPRAFTQAILCYEKASVFSSQYYWNVWRFVVFCLCHDFRGRRGGGKNCTSEMITPPINNNHFFAEYF